MAIDYYFYKMQKKINKWILWERIKSLSTLRYEWIKNVWQINNTQILMGKEIGSD